MSDVRLFEPLPVRDVTLPNRVGVSPMCMYSATDGRASDYHLVHLGRFALGGAGLVIAEATAVAPEGRISHGDLGLWDDSQTEALRPVVEFLHRQGSVAGVQLAHAGRKGSARVAWEGGRPLTQEDAAHGEPPWPVVGPSAIAAGPGWQTPVEMSVEQIAASVEDWRAAARRAVEAGFDVVELHGAHGYLLHAFWSPVSNRREDAYGGSAEARMRYPLEVAAAVREAIGEGRPLLYRVSAVDGMAGGLRLEDTAEFCRRLREAGVDVIDTSSGGIVTDRAIDTRVRRGYAFHTPLSGPLREATGMTVATVGLVVDPHQAEAILQHGDADLVLLGRTMLDDPNWAHHARAELLPGDWSAWPSQSGYAVAARASAMARLAADGEDPLTRYRR
ncbi:MAG: NADH:flavin oxidoreductase/NADH oxidase [Nocardioides sp.]|uniref:NADH:flavin oxidoreductase/NADH oxidase n=1 Tax=Nocardioides sp. TaxID=35761 RepID=UPI0039E5E1DD